MREGRSRKFLDAVEQITFSSAYAAETGQPVFYVTERCVFQRTLAGMELTEVAPGIDIERDILGQMGFKPIVKDPRPMDERIFRDPVMGLEQDLLGLSLRSGSATTRAATRCLPTSRGSRFARSRMWS